MEQFIYKAKQGPQKTTEGSVEAESLEQAIAKIIHLGLAPLEVKKKSDSSGRAVSLTSTPKIFSRKVSGGEVSLFIRQLSDLLEGGIPLLRALGLIVKQTRHPLLKSVLEDIYTAVKDGQSLSDSLGKFPEIFTPLAINMIKSGEVAGNLELVLSRLADFVEHDRDVKSQVISSLIYPAMILILGGGSIVFLLTWVIPKIIPIFEDFNEALPLATTILLAVSRFFFHFWWLLAGILALAVFYVHRLGNTPGGKLQIDRFKLRIPLFGGFLKDSEIGRFARTLAIMVDNGVEIVTGLNSVYLVMENEVLREKVRKITRDVTDGVSLTRAIDTTGFFPEAAVNMVSVGEESGQIPKGLYKIADYYEARCRRFISRVTVLIEPVLILVMGVAVLFVVVAMLMPIFQMNMMIQ